MSFQWITLKRKFYKWTRAILGLVHGTQDFVTPEWSAANRHHIRMVFPLYEPLKFSKLCQSNFRRHSTNHFTWCAALACMYQDWHIHNVDTDTASLKKFNFCNNHLDWFSIQTSCMRSDMSTKFAQFYTGIWAIRAFVGFLKSMTIATVPGQFARCSECWFTVLYKMLSFHGVRISQTCSYSTLQANGFLPIWTLMWLLSDMTLLKLRSQMWHLWGPENTQTLETKIRKY